MAALALAMLLLCEAIDRHSHLEDDPSRVTRNTIISREVSMKRVLLACLVLTSVPALAQQNVPEIQFDSVPNFPQLPKGMNLGEVPGVAVNSKGQVFVFTRSNSANGPAYAPTAAQLLKFERNGKFVEEIGKGLYGWSFAHTVRIDRHDN